MNQNTKTKSAAAPARPVSELWAEYKAGGSDALTEIQSALTLKLHENPQAAALVASQIIGESEAGSESEIMATDVFKRAAACVQLQSPMTLINMFSGCSARMKPEQANRITSEARAFLGQVSRGAPNKTLN